MHLNNSYHLNKQTELPSTTVSQHKNPFENKKPTVFKDTNQLSRKARVYRRYQSVEPLIVLHFIYSELWVCSLRQRSFMLI